MSSPKNPGLKLRVLYISTAGRKVVKVIPQGEMVSIGQETWKMTRGAILPGKGKFDCICVQGQTEALPLWERSPLTSEEFDATAHNNLLEQIHSLSRGNKTSAVNWIQMGMTALLFIAIIGVGIKINSDLDVLGKKIDQGFHPQTGQCVGQNCPDTTTVYTTPQQPASHQPQSLGTGPP